MLHFQQCKCFNQNSATLLWHPISQQSGSAKCQNTVLFMTKPLESRLCLCLFAFVNKSRWLLSPWQVNQHSNAVGRKMAAIYIRPTIIFFVWVVSACMYAYVYVCACIQLYIYMLQYGTTQLRKGFHSTEWTRCFGVSQCIAPYLSLSHPPKIREC